MKAERGRDQINQRRFITDFSIAKKLRAADMSAAAVRFDAPPVIDALKDVLAIFADFQFNDCQSAVISQRQQIDRARASRPTVRSPELRVQRSYD